MGRKLKLTKGRFMREYRRAKTMMELAVALDITVPTAYNYCERYELDVKTKVNNIELSTSIFNAFSGHAVIGKIGKTFGMSRQMIRYHLNRAAHYYWNVVDKCPFNLPKPSKINYIKILHALHKEPSLYGNPDKLSSITGLTFYVIERYLEQVYDYQTKTKKKRRKK